MLYRFLRNKIGLLLAIVFILGSTIGVLAQPQSGSATTSVTVSPNNASITINGFAPPNAFVIVMMDGGVAGTTVADGNGNFQKKLSGIEQNRTCAIALYGFDSNSRQTQTVSFNVDTLPHTDHVVNNIVLPPTISISSNQISLSQAMTVSGSAYPSSDILLFFQGASSLTPVVRTDSEGNWSYVFIPEDNGIGTGNYGVYAKEVVAGGYTSEQSQTQDFSVRAVFPDPSATTDEEDEGDAEGFCALADLNCDGSIDMIDFSILMYFWELENPENPRADINGNGQVDLADYYIMLPLLS